MQLLLFFLGLMSSVKLAWGAQTYNVGDGAGWTTNMNYTAWANQYKFREGDTIVFLYSRGSHDVLRVNQRDYLACSASTPIETDASGETAFQLRAGGYYFICGFPGHCKHQQKVYVRVLPPLSSLPRPSTGGNLPGLSQSAQAPVASNETVPKTHSAPNAASRLKTNIGSSCILHLLIFNLILYFASNL
ncbi:hypothetical protein R1flu_024335 [Riccia fluitans]|uniref:Phytocyanin domain-containing protein n=1 Tax=Riccia fluitans TaxID=41844 RepID=A0ABD1XYQ5_9MARC